MVVADICSNFIHSSRQNFNQHIPT